MMSRLTVWGRWCLLMFCWSLPAPSRSAQRVRGPVACHRNGRRITGDAAVQWVGDSPGNALEDMLAHLVRDRDGVVTGETRGAQPVLRLLGGCHQRFHRRVGQRVRADRPADRLD